MNYPINLKLSNRKCLVVGGGRVAERKVLKLIRAGAKVTIISPILTEKLHKLVSDGEIKWIADNYKKNAAKGFFIVIAATNDEDANNEAISDARSCGAIINAPSNPAESDFFVPAVLRRGDLTVTISTEGASPAFARVMKEELAKFLPENLSEWLVRLRKIREELKNTIDGSKNREFFWKKGLNADVLRLLRDGKLNDAEVELRNGFSRDRFKS
ncbi:MAG: bifunctional precorrin-2 dehydrogenase/sirohydrochlorin ferrochelatase [Selenomonadaceae bacterium]|nr:bifunctional precorrin-2 dehydrogenase/sirohydrochlorin ferrochelatase [Selenomonadaceae bacterium]